MGAHSKHSHRALGLLGWALVVIVVVAYLPFPVLRLAGYEPYGVISGSMEPAIPTGSLVLVHEEPPSELEAGDVVAFLSNGSIVTHRIIEVDEDARTLVTQGDANPVPDMNPVPFSAVEGVVTAHVPLLGWVCLLATGFWGKVIAVGLIVLAVAFLLLSRR